MEKENLIEILEDFIDYLKEKEDDKEKEADTEEVEVIVPADDTKGDDNFNKVIDKISKGE